jgi:hypothetical protein
MGKRIWAAAVAATVMIPGGLVLSDAAQAQFSDSYNFLKSVRDRDGEKASNFLNEAGSGAVIVNTRDVSTGDTALHIVVERRDATWLLFLLQKGANPNIANKRGETPLMAATRLRFLEGMERLLQGGARVDNRNNQGETALIQAVLLRDIDMIRLLLKSGANPDLVDSQAGMSARDYAKRDDRNPALLMEIEKSSKPAADFGKEIKIFGPTG